MGAENRTVNDRGTVLLVGSEANDKRTVPSVGNGWNQHVSAADAEQQDKRTVPLSPLSLAIRPLEQRDLAAAAAIEAAAPDAWSENALRGSLQARQEGGAARLFAAELCGGEKPAEEARDGGVPGENIKKRFSEGMPTARAEAVGSEPSAGKTKEPSPCLPCLAGVAAFQCAAGAASLDTLTVAPGFRRQGVGRALLKAALAQLCAEGAVVCFLEVRGSNAPAIALYQSLGFTVIGRRRGFYQNPAEDALVMRCMLPDALA